MRSRRGRRLEHAATQRGAGMKAGIWMVVVLMGAMAGEVVAAEINSNLAPLTLCKPEEVIVFSCGLTKKRIVSLCASKDANNSSGYMQYRLGRDASTIELEYPRIRALAKDSFKYYTFAFPKGGTAAVSFKVGAYRYSLYSTSSAFGYNGSGVIVNRGKDAIRVSFLKCIDEPVVQNEMQTLFPFFGLQSLDLPAAGDDISFDGPEPGPEPDSELYHPKPGEPENWQLRGISEGLH